MRAVHSAMNSSWLTSQLTSERDATAFEAASWLTFSCCFCWGGFQLLAALLVGEALRLFGCKAFGLFLLLDGLDALRHVALCGAGEHGCLHAERRKTRQRWRKRKNRTGEPRW